MLDIAAAVYNHMVSYTESEHTIGRMRVIALIVIVGTIEDWRRLVADRMIRELVQ
jgi:hypothetical protein